MRLLPEFIQFRAPDGCLAAIERAAKAEGATKSGFIRAAINARLMADQTTQPQREAA